MKCQFGCGGFGSSLCCPPHTPTPAQTRTLVDSYQRAILFEARRGEAKRIAAALERETFLAGYYKAFGLGSGPCRLCDECAFDEGCRHADEARPSMEACGIDVFQTVRSSKYAARRAKFVRGSASPQERAAWRQYGPRTHHLKFT
jgi:predicted metal-binding protein